MQESISQGCRTAIVQVAHSKAIFILSADTAFLQGKSKTLVRGHLSRYIPFVAQVALTTEND